MLILGLYSLATTAFFFLFFFSFSLDALLPMEKDPPPSLPPHSYVNINVSFSFHCIFLSSVNFSSFLWLHKKQRHPRRSSCSWWHTVKENCVYLKKSLHLNWTHISECSSNKRNVYLVPISSKIQRLIYLFSSEKKNPCSLIIVWKNKLLSAE